jgi:polyisoprenoid-binding protein YceI
VSSPTPRKRRWIRWIIGVVVALAVLLVGGPFVYIHFIEGKAPAPLSINTKSTATTTNGSGPSGESGTSSTSGSSAGSSADQIDGTWKVTTGSQVGYRVNEVLFGQNNTAVGRTSSVQGSITITGTTVNAGSFTVDLTTVKSDRSQRDDQFQGRIMDTASFPTATFTLTQPIQLGTIPADGTTITAQATGKLMMHGTTRVVTFPVMARLSGSTIAVSGSIPITFADYNIPSPSFGPVSTDNHGTLEFLLNFSK